MNQLEVILNNYTPLQVCAKAIRKCWDSNDKSDSDKIYCSECNEDITDENIRVYEDNMHECSYCGRDMYPKYVKCGSKDMELIRRVGIKNHHESVLEHLVMNFTIDNFPRAVLQEFSRHRIGVSPSIMSSRYTLKKIMRNISEDNMHKYFYFTGDDDTDELLMAQINILRQAMLLGKSNDDVKHLIPEAMLTNGSYTINMRAFRHLVMLRQGKEVYKPFRELVRALIDAMPREYEYLIEDLCLAKED